MEREGEHGEQQRGYGSVTVEDEEAEEQQQQQQQQPRRGSTGSGAPSDTEGDQQQQQQQHDHEPHAGRDDGGVSSGSGVPPRPADYRAFSRSGINVSNPFHSRRAAVLAQGGHTTGRTGAVDRFAEREEARRREREDELYFNAKYARRPSRRNNEDDEPPSDADYAFLKRNKSDLPLRDLSDAQRHTARQIEEDEKESARRAGQQRSSRLRGSASASDLPSRLRSASASGRGGGGGGGGRLSDEDLLRSIDEMESFLARSKRQAEFSAHQQALGSKPRWQRQLEAMGGPERVGRRNAGIEAHELFGAEEEQYEPEENLEGLHERGYGYSPRRATSSREGYAASTVSSAPFGRPSPFRRSQSRSPSQRRRGGGASSSLPISAADHALDDLSQRGELERRIAYLEDFLDGRRGQGAEDQDDEADQEHKSSMSGRSTQRSQGGGKTSARGSSSSSSLLGHSASERLFASAASGAGSNGGSPVRIPSQHPHRTGKNHVPSSCVYCRREADLRSFSAEARRLVARAFPERKQQQLAEASELDGLGQTEDEAARGVQSRLRPLAKRMLDSTSPAATSSRRKKAAEGAEFPISADVDAHFLSQLSAADRRRQAARLDSLWYLVSSSDRDKHAQLRRIARDIESESTRRHAHMAWLEEQAIERTLRQATVSDKASQREVQRMLTEQAQHVARLLDLKRQSLQNYARDQMDLVAEQQRVAQETARLRAQNDRHSLREMQRQLREQDELARARKMDQLRHAEEKYAFKLSQLRRPQFAQRGIRDLDQWASGRG